MSSNAEDAAAVKSKERLTSKWWKHFTRVPNKDEAMCLLCKRVVVKGGGTTNIKNHLLRHHYSEYYALNRSSAQCSRDSTPDPCVDDENVDDDLAALSPTSPSPSPTPSISPSPSPSPSRTMFRSPSPPTARSTTSASTSKKSGAGARRQPSISEFKVPDAKSTERMNMCVAYFIATCNLPLSTVEKEGFIRLCNTLRPGFKPPGRKALTATHIPRLYLATKEHIAAMLQGAPWVALSSDLWTSVADESYIGLTAHFIDNQWQLFAFTLNCRTFREEHTGINLKEWYADSLNDWKISLGKIVSISIDNGDNVRLAVDLLGKPSMRCFGHTLQTGVTDIDRMETVAALKKSAHKLLSVFGSSVVWRRYEAWMQRTHETTPKSLPSPVKTRWWSELPLLRVLKEEESYHRGFLADYEGGKYLHLRLGSEEMDLLKKYLETLEPLEELCTVLSADQYVTASAVLPVTYALEKLLESAAAATQYVSDIISSDLDEERNAAPDEDMLRCVILKLHKRYSPRGVADDAASGVGSNNAAVRQCDVRGRETLYRLLVKCSYLDPRFRDDLKPEDVEIAKQQLLDEIESSVQHQQTQSVRSGASGDGSCIAPAPKRAKGMASAFARLSGASMEEARETATPSTSEMLLQEISKYSGITVMKDEDILAWWKLHQQNFPLLATLARKYLCIPATSTESERIFSRAGVVINKLRSCLTGEHAEELIFLAMNKKHVPL